MPVQAACHGSKCKTALTRYAQPHSRATRYNRYINWLLIKLAQKGVVYSILSFSQPHLHLNACSGAPVQASLDGVSQSSILDGCKGNAVAWICDGMHLLDESQSREGSVPIHHLVQNAAETPDIRCPADLHGRSTSDVVGAPQNGLWTHVVQSTHLQLQAAVYLGVKRSCLAFQAAVIWMPGSMGRFSVAAGRQLQNPIQS